MDRDEAELLDEVAPIEQFLEDDPAAAAAGGAPKLSKPATTTDRQE